jgi:hypothetical protein
MFVSAACLLLNPSVGLASVAGCPDQNENGLDLSVSNVWAAYGSSVTITADLGHLTTEKTAKVTFKVVCGPNYTGRSFTTQSVTDPGLEAFPGLSGLQIFTPSMADETYSYSGPQNATDDIAVTADLGKRQVIGYVWVEWRPPSKCSKAFRGFLDAFDCVADTVNTMRTIGGCAAKVASIVGVPETEFATILSDAKDALQLKKDAEESSQGATVVKFVKDLVALGHGTASSRYFRDLEAARTPVTFIRDVWALVQNVSAGQIRPVLIDLANLTGLGSCVDLLASKTLLPPQPPASDQSGPPTPPPFPTGSVTIGAAHALVPGETYSVNLATQQTARLAEAGETQDGGLCPMWAGQYWLLNLQAGQQATVNWSYSSPAAGFYQFLVFSPGTNDSDVNAEAENGQQDAFVNEDSSPASGTFTAPATGSYPFMIGDGCPSTSGPFQFTVTTS